MGIKNPSTYGEWYWKNKVEADAAFDEQKEDALSPLFAGLIGSIPEIKELPASMRQFLYSLSSPRSAGLGTLLQLTGGEFLAEVLKEALNPAFTIMKRANNRRSLETWLTGKEAVT